MVARWRWARLFPVTLVLLLPSGHAPHPQPQGGRSAFMDGDFLIGALFSVHHQPKQRRGGGGPISCGEVRELYGIQRVEATFHTLDAINSNPDILPNVRLGAEIRDSCWYAPVALQQSLEFIRDAISPQRDAGECDAKVSGRAPLVGVVGPGSSSAALQVQNLLQLFQIPQIGYSTTSRDLSDKNRFGYFLRVVPSDYYQAQVMVDIVRQYNWTYVSAVNTDENYGQSGMQAFRELAEKANVCIAKEDSVLSNAEDEVFDAVIRKLDQDQNARVVVCFCEGMTVRGLLAATQRLNLTGRFVFLGSDGWADRADVVDGFEWQARGSLSVRIHSPYERAFDAYYHRLSPDGNARNPWFREFWQWRFNCSLDGDDADPTRPRRCSGEERLSDRYKQDPKLSFVIKAIYTLAYGLHDLHQDLCGRGARGLCPQLSPINGALFKNYLLNVSFQYGEGEGEVVEFDRRGDPPGRYNIMNFQQLSDGSFDYIHVGDWNNGSLQVWADMQVGLTGEKVESVCSKPCPPGYYKNLQTGGQEQRCCWVCVPCDRHEHLVDELTCRPCPPGHWPNTNKTACAQIPLEVVQWTDTAALVSMGCALLGLLATAFSALVFVRHHDTPVVKSSTRELSYLLLAGMGLSHASVLPVLARPSAVSCGLARALPGLSFAMIYASLLTKTNRIARILAGSKKRFPSRKMRFMSATAQVVMSLLLISLEVGVAGAMLVLEPPGPALHFPALDRAVLVCNTSAQGVVVPLAFDFFLIALCTLYAIKTRNVPENFNEAKFIGFAMYTTCVIWIAFVPIYFGSDSKVITMCLCVTLSATVTLACLFGPKLYIMLVRPERNIRALFTTSKEIRCHIGSTANRIAVSPRTMLKQSWQSSEKNSAQATNAPARCVTLNGSDGRESKNWKRHSPAEWSPPEVCRAAAHTQTDHWLLLSPTALLKSLLSPLSPLSTRPRQRVRVREESVTDDDDEEGQLKNITIRLGSSPSVTSE